MSIQVDSASLVALPTVRPKTSVIKQEGCQLAKANGANKHVIKSQTFNFYLVFSLVTLKSKKVFLKHMSSKTFICLILFFGFSL